MDERILVVSGDSEAAAEMVAVLEASGQRSVTVIRSGSECLESVPMATDGMTCTVVVDAGIQDVSPMNLVGALSAKRPDVGIIVLSDSITSDVTQKAMLAGARAVVDRARLHVDFVPTVKRVAVSGTGRTASAGVGEPGGAPGRGRSIAVVGAKGGAGRTTTAVLLAEAAAARGADVGLLDVDLQFGDISFVYDVTPEFTLVNLVRDMVSGASDPKNYAWSMEGGPFLYAPAPHPEQAEIVAPRIRQLVTRLASAHDLVVVNTGAFWTLLHAELLDAVDLCVFIMSPTATGVRATVQAKALCARLGIPDAKMLFVMNRHAGKGAVTSTDAAAALGVSSVTVLPDGGAEVAAYLDAGDVSALVHSRSPLPGAVERLLETCATLVGYELGARAPTRKGLFG